MQFNQTFDVNTKAKTECLHDYPRQRAIYGELVGGREHLKTTSVSLRILSLSLGKFGWGKAMNVSSSQKDLDFH